MGLSHCFWVYYFQALTHQEDRANAGEQPERLVGFCRESGGNCDPRFFLLSRENLKALNFGAKPH